MNTSQLELDVGFSILCHEHNFSKFKSTYNSIRRHNPKSPITCIVKKTIVPSLLQEIKGVCLDTYKGKETIISLLNEGIKKGHKHWNMILLEGVIFRPGALKRYERFATSEKDVLFPIFMKRDMEGKPEYVYTGFLEHESMLNGMVIHQKTFKEVGEFSENPFDISRMWWAMDAKDKGVNFKGVLGTKII